MKINLILRIAALFCFTAVNAQIIDYDDATRRVLVDGNGFGDTSTTIINDYGFWNFDDFISSDSGTYQGSMQISNLGTESICSRSYTWNSITGSHPSGGDAQSSLITSFTLESDSRYKIDFFGAIHADTYQGYLFIPPQLFLKQGLSGSNGTLINIVGSGIEYIDLTAGDYQITTAVGSSYNCSNDPNCVAFISGQSQFSFTTVTLSDIAGSSYSSPFLPDSYSETQSPDFMSLTPEGAIVIRGEYSTYNYVDRNAGWFDIGSEKQAFINLPNEGIVTSIQLPENRLGVFQIKVADILLGEFNANDIVTFADFSAELGDQLITGFNNAKGVNAIEVKYQNHWGDNSINACGDQNNTAIKLTFDINQVSFNVEMPFIPLTDEIFFSGFEPL
ncbi:MAG: hypothetical protein AB8B80_13215 [Marinicellaceae bacterium]